MSSSSTASRPAPPKPWERAGAGGATLSGVTGATGPSTAATTAASAPVASSMGSSSTPALPPRPADMGSSSSNNASALTSTANTTSAMSSSYNANNYANRMGGYGSSYGGYGGGYGSAYTSPYSRFGGGGYGGYGSYGGGGYGSYGSPFGFGAPGANDVSLTRQMESGTAATFQLLQSVVSAFGGFAQMLESTFMATHSSFFAMIGVAEQLTSLRNWLGEVLSVFTLWRLIKRLLGRGEPPSAGGASQAPSGLSASEFAEFQRTGRTTPAPGTAGSASGPAQPKPSKKPLIIFFLTVVGLPWLMNKLVRLITARQEAEARRLGLPEGVVPPVMGQDGQPLPQHMQPPGVDLALFAQIQQQQQMGPGSLRLDESALDPSKLTFVRAVHPFQSTANDEFELTFDRNDIIAVLTPKEERQDPGWWRGRLRNGKVGWFPSTHVQEVPMSGASTPAASKKA